MRALAFLTLGLLSSTAFAGSELQLKSSMPVNLHIDGESVGTVQPLEPLRIDIEAGVHNLQIKGLLGKELYDRDLIFDDNTRTELLWQRKELRLGAVVQLEAAPETPAAPPAPPQAPQQVAQAPAPPAAPAPAPAAPTPPPAAPPAPPTPPAVAHAPAPPAPVAAPPAPTPPVARPAPVVHAATAPAPAPAASPNGSVVIQATENLDLQITHGTQLLRISVENGELVLRDSSGTQIRFPANGQAF